MTAKRLLEIAVLALVFAMATIELVTTLPGCIEADLEGWKGIVSTITGKGPQ